MTTAFAALTLHSHFHHICGWHHMNSRKHSQDVCQDKTNTVGRAEWERGGRNVVLSLGALRSLRLSSHGLYLIWKEGWNLVIPPNEQKILPRAHRDGEGLSGTLRCWHFWPCSGFRGRDKDEAGNRMHAETHSPEPSWTMCIPRLVFPQRDDLQTASAGC